MRIGKLIGLMVGAALANPAQAAPAACMTETEMSALIAYMAPPVLRSATTVCSPTGQSPFLAGPGAQSLIGQYEGLANRNWPQAKSAMLKMMSDEGKVETALIANLSDTALRELMNAGFVAAVAGDIKAKDCAKIDRLARTLSQVPAEPATQLITALMALTQDGKFNLCKAG